MLKVLTKLPIYDDQRITQTLVKVQEDNGQLLFEAKLDGNYNGYPDEEVIDQALKWLYATYFGDKYAKEEIKVINEKLKEAETIKETLEEIKQQQHVLKQNQENQAKAFILATDLTEEDKAIFMDSFEDYQIGVSYQSGKVLDYNGTLYEVIQSHTSQADWLPDNTPSLYKLFTRGSTTVDGEVVDIVSDFKQPTGAHDAYKLRDKVNFNGKVYESTIDNNAYSPETYPQGWKEV